MDSYGWGRVMDGMRGLSGGYSQNDGAIDAPPAIGVDERRMQARAFNHWMLLRGDRAYPSIDDLDLSGMGFAAYSILLDFLSGSADPVIAFLGENLRAESQIGDGVSHASQIPAGSLLSHLTRHYLHIITNRAPISVEAEFESCRGVIFLYRGILLPLSSDSETIDRIWGVINWREVASADEVDTLQRSVAQALRSASPLTAPVPLWAGCDPASSGDCAHTAAVEWRGMTGRGSPSE